MFLSPKYWDCRWLLVLVRFLLLWLVSWPSTNWGPKDLIGLTDYSPSLREFGADTKDRNWNRGHIKILATGGLLVACSLVQEIQRGTTYLRMAPLTKSWTLLLQSLTSKPIAKWVINLPKGQCTFSVEVLFSGDPSLCEHDRKSSQHVASSAWLLLCILGDLKFGPHA